MTLRTVAHQAPLSMGFSRKGYWSGLSFPSPGDLPEQGIEPTSPVFPASASGLFYQLSHLGSPNPYPEVKLLVTQSCLTLCDSMDYSPPGSLSMEFSRQEYRSVLPFPSPGDLPDQRIKLRSPALEEDSLLSELPGNPYPIHLQMLSALPFSTSQIQLFLSLCHQSSLSILSYLPGLLQKACTPSLCS